MAIAKALRMAVDDGQVSILTLLDLSAAFDTIDHSILLDRLQNTFGISEKALLWIRSYLSDRKQVVVVDGVRSQPEPVKFGVPQGSVLGPVLFTLYSSPLAKIIESHRVKHHSYADDTQINKSATLKPVLSLEPAMRSCCTDVRNWMTTNKLKLNAGKTEAMFVGTPRRLSAIATASIQLESGIDTPIASVVKNLGCLIDSSLSMTAFIRQTAKSCNYHLRRIASIRHLLDVPTTTKLVTSLILSRLDYCNALLSNIPDVSLESLVRVQRNAARLIHRKRKRDHITPQLMQLHWLPIRNRIEYKIITICHKCLHSTAPKYLKDKIPLKKQNQFYELKSNDDNFTLKPNKAKLVTFGNRAFSVYGPKVWNRLPLQLRQISSHVSFKQKLKTHLFNQAYNQ